MVNVPKQTDSAATAAGLYQNQLIRRFLNLYADDPKFTGALGRLFNSHAEAFREMARIKAQHTSYWDSFLFIRWHDVVHEVRFGDSVELAEYADALRSFAEKWGLDLLPRDAGMDAIHAALFWKSENRESTWHFTFHEMRELPGVPGVDYSTSPPSVVLIPELRWRPEWDSSVDARAMIDEACRQAKSLVTEIVKSYVEAGYLFPAKSGRTDEHLRWLYQRIAYRDPVHLIGDPQFAESSTVKERTRELARDLGIKRIPRRRRT